MRIAERLSIGRGITALIGGGGKTTLLYTLAEELRGRGRVLLCTSTHIRLPQQYPLLPGPGPALEAALAAHGVVCVGTPAAEEGKLTAPEGSFAQLAACADFVLVEADGSRGLPLKAHAAHEPVIPPDTQQVVLLLGADGFGRRVEEVCHRPELYARRAGCRPEDIVTPERAARVLLAEGLGDRILINKAESDAAYAAATELAAGLPWPVVAGSLQQGVYVCLS